VLVVQTFAANCMKIQEGHDPLTDAYDLKLQSTTSDCFTN